MKQVTVKIPEKNFEFFMELVKSLGFVKKVEAVEEPTKTQILHELKEAVHELQLIEKGKLKSRPTKDLINEL